MPDRSESPEAYIFEQVFSKLDQVSGELAVALLRPYEDHQRVEGVIKSVRNTIEILMSFLARLVLTSQLRVTRWHEQIGGPTVADGILYRLVHNAHRIEMGGDSMRKIAVAQQLIMPEATGADLGYVCERSTTEQVS